ncbi:MAG: urocanate hydratase [Euryarchaeota archaeon]|jgi:urocanate hydratase|nr:urocanate hydratase [Euryarchaeota archaeon]
MAEWDALRASIIEGIPNTLPEHPGIDNNVDHAPKRRDILSPSEKRLALSNALRYFPKELHETLAKEFASELQSHGRIYMHRFRPTGFEIKAQPISAYPAKCTQAAAIMLMIQNNLDENVAQFPHELITYGGNGAVFQNWAQYRMTMKYLSEMTDKQTLVMYSGHPLGLFPSSVEAPRVVVTNGMVIPNYSSQEDYERLNALGVSQYGQMTAGSYMYIGPQGIVHGTTITLLNAGRKYLGIQGEQGLFGKTYVTSGLGGMSGAQAKAAVIAGASSIIAEVNPVAAYKRQSQGWLDEVIEDVDEAIDRMLECANNSTANSIGFVGNIVSLWERLVERDVRVDLGSDQTSLHNPWQGGYFPVQISFEESKTMMAEEPDKFKSLVQESLRRQSNAINSMSNNGMRFWDYGNAFLLEASRAGAEIVNDDGTFHYPSYVEDIMGPMCFDFGFGPFRWVCTSGDSIDLTKSDEIATRVLQKLADSSTPDVKQQMLDNVRWITEAAENEMVVGSQARILYADEQGRRMIAQAFNDAINSGVISAPIVLGRDHHDVSGTDSPYRETANIKDGSMFTADMAVHNFVGDSFRGATWVSLHNGGGVGWGEVINGGFGLVLDGSEEASIRLNSMLSWDVNNGIARRAWARNKGAVTAAERAMNSNNDLNITIPNLCDDDLISQFFEE